MKLQAHGIETDLPPGWEGRIGLRTQPSAATASRAIGDPGETTNPIVHLANFALPEQRGDFGSGAVDLMGEQDVLVVLFEYGPECANTDAVQAQGPAHQAHARHVLGVRRCSGRSRGQAGCQIFFTEADRAFCCYTVLGRQSSATRVLPQANSTLARTRILPR